MNLSFKNIKHDYNDRITDNPTDILCSQVQSSDLMSEVYEKLENHLKRINCDNFLEEFNIQWLKQQKKQHFRSKKIPVLAVIIRNLDLSHLYVDAVFKDLTGRLKWNILSFKNDNVYMLQVK